MNKQEILEAFKKAEIDWSSLIENRFETRTNIGLCHYFEKMFYRSEVLELSKYWICYKTVEGRSSDLCFHFHSNGSNCFGRQQRLDAIRKVINYLEQPTWILRIFNKYFTWKSKKF